MTNSNATSSARSLSPAKRRLFTVIVIAIPFLFIVVVEVALRLANYGGTMDLVVKSRWGGKEVYRINRGVARRYFAQPGSIVPEPADDAFEITKPPDTKRIFCLGESTMAGFPFELLGPAPSFMQDRLNVWLPHNHVEVINVGLSAVNTFVVEDFLKQLLPYEPDLFVVYVGHNEFYGIYGVGSSIAIPGGTWLTRLNIQLLHWRTFLLLRSWYYWILQHVSASPKGPSPSLMGQMVGNQTIPIHSNEYERAREIYRENLGRIISVARHGNVPILFAALVSNWRGQKPFVSVFDTHSTDEARTRWRSFMSSGDSAIARGSAVDAIRSYKAAIEIDSINALAYFQLGTAQYEQGDYVAARNALVRAKDLDALRFRATEEFENDLLAICRERGVPVARVDSAFMAASPHGILDGTLFLEHLHPTIEGYFLMAKTICRTIKNEHLLGGDTLLAATNDLSDSVYMELSRVTDFDRSIGKVKIDLLKRKWPFETGPVNYEFKAANSIESVVFRMLRGGIGWSDARYLLAEFYARNKQYDLARKECLAVSRIIPFSYEPLLRYADYFYDEHKYREAKAAYQQCLNTEENPFARMKYALILIDEGNYAGGASQIEIALSPTPAGRYTLTPDASATARYLLGGAYAKMGKLDLAKDNLQRALAINPDYKDARDLLNQIVSLR